MTYLADRYIAPPGQEGWTRHQEKYREAFFAGADGVVVQDQAEMFLNLNHHPACAASDASRFLTGAATPPGQGRWPAIIARLCVIVCFGAAWGCGSRTASQTPSAAVPPVFQPLPSPTASAAAKAVDCALLSGQDAIPIAIVGLNEQVDPAHAPRPSNDGERLLFRQLYETLIQMDCAGNPMPGLAAFWRLDASRKTWTVALRPDARFSDDTPVTTADVVASWMSSGDGRGNGSELRPQVRRLVQSIVAVDDRTLEITLRSQRADAPLALAHTDLAVAKSVPGSLWPLGTRPAKVDPGVAPPASARPSVIMLMRLPVNSDTVRFLVSSGRDSRDLLDQGVDLLVTRDPTTLGYAATLPQFVTTPLPWRRTHVLLTPAGTARIFSPEERRALAQDAVRGEARGAQGPFWWESLPDCEIPSSKTPPQPPSATRRIIYDADDGAARDLAERLVGIGTYPRAAALTGDALAQALRRGNEAGYILSLDRVPLDACRELQVLLDRAGWIDPQTFVPLVDTRLQAIVRRGRSGMSAEWDGTLLLGGIGK